MKTTLLPTLLLAGLLLGSLAPAQAQTTLLKIDYQNATVFHVLDDGRLLLPTGAADGYVLTADSDGYATWQAASGSGGLSVVSSDATLTGEGTAASPLGVAVPLTLTGSESLGAVQGEHSSGNFGWLGGSNFGVVGSSTSGYGVYGENGGIYGYLGGPTFAVYGEHSSGNFGRVGSQFHGVYGAHANGPVGWLGGSGFGAVGEHTNGNYGTLGSGTYGAYGAHANGNYGWLGGSTYAVYGRHKSGTEGYLGSVTIGVQGMSSTTVGALGASHIAVFGDAEGSDWAGYFNGHAFVVANFSVGGVKSFKIDHLLDPAGKYLNHFSIESDEVLNVYSGTVHLNAQGEANVVLPAWMEALNINFRYQLTAIGAPGPNLYIAEKISGNTFKIAGGEPGMEVSWQVTGVRNDPAVQALKPAVEEEKPPRERGYYVHPQFYGQPQERSILWARDPAMIRELQVQAPSLRARRSPEQQ